MAIKYFQNLTAKESALLIKAPALITVLIAGADNDIDKKETDWAAKVINYRTFTAQPKLQDYYEVVNEGFEALLNSLIADWSLASNEAIIAELASMNASLAKVDQEYAGYLKASWRSLAAKVAGASGGILGFGSVDSEEKKLIDLPMID